jgi:signal transduction histidine kinase
MLQRTHRTEDSFFLQISSIDALLMREAPYREQFRVSRFVMRLSEFIRNNIEPIVDAWEDFARTLEIPGQPLSTLALRDHAEAMLLEIAVDLDTPQSAEKQMKKSQGRDFTALDEGARAHASARLLSGFTLDQVVSEFRALRASVMHLWSLEPHGDPTTKIEDIIRFNEAIDQALALSIGSYAASLQASRNIFLGILGHDLRTPLNAILLGADLLLRTDDLGSRATKISSRIYASVKRATQIVGDLLDFTRSQVGPGLPIRQVVTDVAPLCKRIISELRMAHPDVNLVLDSDVAVVAEVDGARLEQVFSNLIGNAIQHGSRKTPVAVKLQTVDDEIQFSVHNLGPVIPAAVLPTMFNPMGRYSTKANEDYGPYASLGLGLFIASQIVESHAGRISVESDAASGTQFLVSLPISVLQ